MSQEYLTAPTRIKVQHSETGVPEQLGCQEWQIILSALMRDESQMTVTFRKGVSPDEHLTLQNGKCASPCINVSSNSIDVLNKIANTVVAPGKVDESHNSIPLPRHNLAKHSFVQALMTEALNYDQVIMRGCTIEDGGTGERCNRTGIYSPLSDKAVQKCLLKALSNVDAVVLDTMFDGVTRQHALTLKVTGSRYTPPNRFWNTVSPVGPPRTEEAS